jgi:predicted lipid-binding transport protein (Tim44 family)
MIAPIRLASELQKDVAMKSLILALSVAVFAAGMAPLMSEAKRLGGGGSSGMQRSTPPPRSAPDSAPAKPAQAAPAAAAAPAPAAAPKRSWMGPLAGLAAGLGIAALMSHFGMGAEFGNIIMMVLLALVAFVAIRFVMARFGRGTTQPTMATPNGMQFAGAGAGNNNPPALQAGSGWGSAAAAAPVALPAVAAAAAVAGSLPEGFDAPAFERIAKMIFIRLQAANDSSDLNDLRNFTTPEMFASIRLELQERGASTQQTDVVKIDAEVLDFASESERQVVSVRFHGLIREDKGGVANPFDEVWHMVKPLDGSREWAIAGIQQSH